MNENEFSSALQAAALSQLPPPQHVQEIVQQILRSDRRRTRVLAFFSIFFWLCASAGLIVLVFGLNRFVLFVRINQQMQFNNGVSSTTRAALDESENLMLWGTSFIHHSMPYLAGSVAAFMLAAMCTVMLIFSSRQSVLNRINLNLAQMSAQLQQMRQSPNAAPNRAGSA